MTKRLATMGAILPPRPACHCLQYPKDNPCRPRVHHATVWPAEGRCGGPLAVVSHQEGQPGLKVPPEGPINQHITILNGAVCSPCPPVRSQLRFNRCRLLNVEKALQVPEAPRSWPPPLRKALLPSSDMGRWATHPAGAGHLGPAGINALAMAGAVGARPVLASRPRSAHAAT